MNINKSFRIRQSLVFGCILFLVPLGLKAQNNQNEELSDAAKKAIAEIRAEVVKFDTDKGGRPFPLAATWAPLEHNFSPEYQLGLIKQGHHLILCFGWPYSDKQWGGENHALPRYQKMRLDNFKKYFEPVLIEAARLKLPISFQRFQFEMELTTDKKYIDLPPEQNPGVIGLDGKIQRKVDPMGPIEPWFELGKEHVTSMCMKLAQEIYPDPPLVIFLSNNEHPVLQHYDAEQSKRYLDKYGKGKDADFRRKVFADALIEHYRAVQEGMRDGLVSDTWKKNVRFIAYEAFGPPHLGRWGGWLGHSSYFSPTTGKMTWQHLGWDGGSPSYYTHHWAGFLTDYTSGSMQVEAMNWPFMLEDVYKENPEFWFELSTWDGDQYGIAGKRSQYAVQGGQIYNADRYQGMLQYGLWLLRPRALRDFRYLESLEYAEPYYLANVKAVDQVYDSALLRKFWRRGELVSNPERKHPYQSNVSEEIQNRDRWFLLTTDLESPKTSRNWGLHTDIPVFALALVMGEAPDREWLVFAHSPHGARTGVTVKIPEFGDIKIDASLTGAFYHVLEKGKQVICAIPGGPVSARIVASTNSPKPGEKIIFKATDVFSPTGKKVDLQWDFADGQKGSGDNVSHAFSKKGQYIVALTAENEKGEKKTTYEPISVGYPELDKCLLFLPLEKTPEIGYITERVQTGKLEWFPEFVGIVYAANTKDFCGLNFGCKWADDSERGQVLQLSEPKSYLTVHGFYDAENNKMIPRYDALGRDRTTAFWFKADDVLNRQSIYQDGNSNANGLNIYLDNGKIYAGSFSKSIKDWKGEWLSSPVEKGKWYFVTLVLDNAEKDKLTDCLKFYLNGKLVGTAKAALNRPIWARIGGYWSTRFHDDTDIARSISFTGYVDDFAVFYKALNEEEIKSLMEGN